MNREAARGTGPNQNRHTRTELERSHRLTMVVLREFGGPIFFWGIIGAAPFILLNQLALMHLLDIESIMLGNELYTTTELLYGRYIYHSMSLVFLEAPFALQALTYYLGQAVFVERPHWREVLKCVKESFWKCVWILGILRGALLGLPLVFCIPHGSAFYPFIEVLLLGFGVLFISLAVRVFRPFAPEMLMLERSPLKKPKMALVSSIRPEAPTSTIRCRRNCLAVPSSWLLSSALCGAPSP